MPVDRVQTPQKASGEQPPSSPPPTMPALPTHPSTCKSTRMYTPNHSVFETAPWGHQDVERRISRTTPENVVLAGTSAQATRLEGASPERPGTFVALIMLTLTEHRPTPVTGFVKSGGMVYCSDFPSTPELAMFDLPNDLATREDGPFRLSSLHLGTSPAEESDAPPHTADSSLDQAMPPAPQPSLAPATDHASRRKIAARWRSVFSRPAPAVADEDDTRSSATTWGSGSKRSMTLDDTEGDQGDEITAEGATEATRPAGEGATPTDDDTPEDLSFTFSSVTQTPTAEWLEYLACDIVPSKVPFSDIRDWLREMALHLPPTPEPDVPASRFSTASAKLAKPLRRLLSRRSLRNSTISVDSAEDEPVVRDSVVISEASFGTPVEYVPRRPAAEGRKPSPLALEQTTENEVAETSDTTLRDEQVKTPSSSGDIFHTPPSTPWPATPALPPAGTLTPDPSSPPLTPTSSTTPFYLTPGPGPTTHLWLEVMFATEPQTYATPHQSALEVDFSTTLNWVNPSPERTVESVAQVWEDVRMGVAQLRGETLRLAYIPLLETEPPITPPTTGTPPESSVQSDVSAEVEDTTHRLTRRLSCRAMSTLASPMTTTTSAEGEASSPKTVDERDFLFRKWSTFTMSVNWRPPGPSFNTRFRRNLDSDLSVIDETESRASSPRSSISTIRPSLDELSSEFGVDEVSAELDVDEFSAVTDTYDEPTTPLASPHQLPVVSPGPHIRPPKPKVILDNDSSLSKPLQKEPWGAITSMLDAFAQFAFEAEIADTRLVAMAHGHEPFYLATAANPAVDRIVFLALLTSLANTIIESFPPASLAGEEGRRLRSIVGAFVQTSNGLFEPFAETQGVIGHLSTRRISRLVNGGKKMRILGPTMRRKDYMAGVEVRDDEDEA